MGITEIFARPLGALLKIIYDLVVNVGVDFETFSAYGLTIIITTIIFRFMLLPLTLKQTKSMKKMQELQPKIQELQKKYKHDKEALNVKTMELYKENKVNPLGGCFPLLIQFPIIIGFFKVLRQPIDYVFKNADLYASINKSFLWIKNLEDPDLWVLPVLAALTTYFSSKMMSANNNTSNNKSQAQSTQKIMTYMMPLMILWFSRNFAAGLALYWVIGNLFQIGQQYFMKRYMGTVKEESN